MNEGRMLAVLKTVQCNIAIARRETHRPLEEMDWDWVELSLSLATAGVEALIGVLGGEQSTLDEFFATE